jgi:hypothetical protein
MKEHAKKALKHDISVAGKTIPTMIIVALFLVGGGSAAILSSFGTVSGEADVEQAVVVGDSSGNNQLGFFGASSEETADVTAGTVTVDTFTIENNMNDSYSPTFTSYDATNTDGSSVSSSTQFEWAGGGIRTSFVEYYPEAGADIPDYEGPSDSECDVRVGDSDSADNSSISDGISYAESGDTVCVEPATYDVATDDARDILVDKNELKLVSLGETRNRATILDDDDRTIDVTGNNVVIKGFKFEGSDIQEIVYVQADGFEMRHNLVADDTEASMVLNLRPDTAYLDGSTEINSAVVRNNDFGDMVDASAILQGSSGANLTLENNRLPDGTQISTWKNADISNNSFGQHPSDGYYSQYSFAMFLDVDDADVTSNRFENSGIGLRVSSPAQVTVSSNSFIGNDVAIKNDGDKELDANENFFDQGTWPAVSNGNFEGGVDASYKQVDSIPANSTKTVAAVNEFALMLDGSQDYSLTTTIQ